jgi:hypothetical protein
MLNEEIVKAGYASVMTIPLISNSRRSFRRLTGKRGRRRAVVGGIGQG